MPSTVAGHDPPRPPPRRIAALCATSLALATVPGCSLALDGPAAGRRLNEAPSCDRSKSLVVLDGVWTGAFGIAALAAFSGGEGEVGVAALLGGAIFAAAAARGNRIVDECRAADEQYAAYRAPVLPDEVVESTPSPTPPRRRREIDDGMAREQPMPVKPIATLPGTPPVPVPPPQQPPQPAPTPAPSEPDGSDWGDFWEEVP